MADVKISQLPSGTANANAVVPATNAAGTTTEKITLGSIRDLAHTHGFGDVSNNLASLTQFTASQNDLALGTGGIIRISSNAAVNITGIAATTSGDARLLVNVGTYAITLKHSSSSSTAANRILCVDSADIEVKANGSVVVFYDGTDSRWRAG